MSSSRLVIDLPDAGLAEFGGGLSIFTRSGSHVDLVSCELSSALPDYHAFAELDASAAKGSDWLNAFDIAHSCLPFPHIVAKPALADSAADRLVAWLDSIHAWRLNDGGFYSALEINLLSRQLPSGLAHLCSAQGRTKLESQASRLFRKRLRLSNVIAVHRMDAGHGIGIHSDRPDSEQETHRLVVTLVPKQFTSGGHFIMLAGPVAADARRLVPLQHNVAIAFPLSAKSYHAVTNIQVGRRYSVVISFGSA